MSVDQAEEQQALYVREVVGGNGITVVAVAAFGHVIQPMTSAKTPFTTCYGSSSANIILMSECSAVRCLLTRMTTCHASSCSSGMLSQIDSATAM